MIGIHIGNAHTYVTTSLASHSNVVIADGDGIRSIPTSIALVDGEYICGADALSFMNDSEAQYWPNFYSHYIRSITGDTSLDEDGLVWKEGKVGYLGDFGFVSCRSLLEQFLKYAGSVARAYLSATMSADQPLECVLTAPTYKDDDKVREELKQVGESTGLVVKAVVSEVAALVANAVEEGTVSGVGMVVDVGYLKSKVSLVSVSNGMISVIEQVVVEQLCVKNIEELVHEWALSMYEKESGKKASEKVCRKFRGGLELCMKQIATQPKATFFVEGVEGVDKMYTLQRHTLDQMLLQKTLCLKKAVNEVLEQNEVQKMEVKWLILAGGGMRLPSVQMVVTSLFHPKYTSVVCNEQVVEYSGLGCLSAYGQQRESAHSLKFALGLLGLDGYVPLVSKYAALPLYTQVKIKGQGLIKIDEVKATVEQVEVDGMVDLKLNYEALNKVLELPINITQDELTLVLKIDRDGNFSGCVGDVGF